MPAITDVDELQAMKDDLNGTYWLANDIDASATSGWNGGAGFDPVGDNVTPFEGNFDGKEYVITGLFINRPTEYYCGLFGYVKTTAEIKNVGIVNCDITAQRLSGALVGYNGDGANVSAISDCYSTGAIKGSGTAWVGALGGLVGFNETASTITDCYSTATITVTVTPVNAGLTTNLIGGLIGGNDGVVTDSYATGDITVTVMGAGDDAYSIGGFTGDHADGSISGCYSTGNVTVSSEEFLGYVGGFIGDNSNTITKCFSTGNVDVTATNTVFYIGGFAGLTFIGCDNCYARGDVSATSAALNSSEVGGFTGYVDGGETVENCYSTGLITTTGTFTDVGGFCGKNDGTVTNCFWDTETSGTAVSDGGTGKTTAEMKTKATFTDATWDFIAIWGIHTTINDGYPFLWALLPEEGESPRLTVAIQEKITLESIRNIEMSARGRFRVSKDGNAVYRSRYARNV